MSSRSIQLVNWNQPINWSHPLNRGLVSWLLTVPGRVGFSSNTWLDLCKRYNGTLTNMSPFSDWVGDGRGGRWGALVLDGIDDFVEFNAVGLFGGSQSWTLSIWINPSTLVGNSVIWTPRGERDVFIRLNNLAGTPIQFAFYDTTTKGINTINPVVGTWYHCVMVWNAANSLFYAYVNGISYGSSATGTPASRSDKNTIGAQYFSGVPNNEFGGKVDNYRLYNRALSGVEVRALYQQSRSYHPELLNRNQIKRYFVAVGGGGGSATDGFYYYRMMQG